jgi:hypothetical protein
MQKRAMPIVSIAGSDCPCGRHKFSAAYGEWFAWGPLGRLPLKGEPRCVRKARERVR